MLKRCRHRDVYEPPVGQYTERLIAGFVEHGQVFPLRWCCDCGALRVVTRSASGRPVTSWLHPRRKT